MSHWQQDFFQLYHKKMKCECLHTGSFPGEEQPDPWHCLMCLPHVCLSCSRKRVASTWPLSFLRILDACCVISITGEPLTRGATPSLQVLVIVFVRAVATVPKMFECLVFYQPYESCHLVLNVKVFKDTSH